jgi:hypothetical protein
MDPLSILIDFLLRFMEPIDREAVPESIAGDPGLYWLSVIGSALFVGIIYLVSRPARKKPGKSIESNYGPATLCVEEQRVPLVEDDSRTRATFDDVGIYGRMSITGEVER